MAGEFDDLIGEADEEPKALEPRPKGKNFVEYLSDNTAMANFLDRTKNVPLEFIADCVIDQGYAAALWKFRSAALSGDALTAKALKMWLDWAGTHIAKPKKGKVKHVKNPISAAFIPRKPDDV